MKKALAIIVAVTATVICLLSNNSCSADIDKGKEVDSDTALDSTNTVAIVEKPEDGPSKYGYITFSDAHDKFDIKYAESYYEYEQAVYAAIDDIRSETEKLYLEIIDIMESSYYPNYVLPVHPDRTPEEFRERFVAPFIEYYETRKEAADKSMTAFSGIGSVLTFPTAAGSRSTLLWSYVNNYNFYVELLEIKASITIR